MLLQHCCWCGRGFKCRHWTHFHMWSSARATVDRTHRTNCLSYIRQLHLDDSLLPATMAWVAGGGVRFFIRLSVCLFFCMISQRPMQLESPNLTQKCSTMTPGNPSILGSKRQMSRSRVTKNCSRGSLYSCECWFLLVHSLFT